MNLITVSTRYAPAGSDKPVQVYRATMFNIPFTMQWLEDFSLYERANPAAWEAQGSKALLDLDNTMMNNPNLTPYFELIADVVSRLSEPTLGDIVILCGRETAVATYVVPPATIDGEDTSIVSVLQL